MFEDNVVKVESLSLETINNLEIKETIRIESNGEVINDTWEDIPKKLSELLGDFINVLWYRSPFNSFKFTYNDRQYSLWHGNTKWFSLTRLS